MSVPLAAPEPNEVAPISTPPKSGRRGYKRLFGGRKKSVRLVRGSPEVTRCCFPVLRRKDHHKKTGGWKNVNVNATDVKQVRFSAQPSGISCMATPKVLRKKSHLNSKGLKIKQPSESAFSRRSFYTAASTVSRLEKFDDIDETDDNEDTTTTAGTESEEIELQEVPQKADEEKKEEGQLCLCAAPAHSVYDPMMPLLVGPDIEPGSTEELMAHAKSILGCWVTMLDRSQSLDPQMVHVGIGKIKRSIMNKLAIPFTCTLTEDDSLLDCWITTPVGNKHTRSSLVGKETEDKDGDLGDWVATTSIVDHSIPWFCNGKTVRAMQMKRLNPKLGIAYETRVVIPDAAEGKILFYNITMHPPDDKPIISVDRLMKFTGPLQ